MDDFYLTRKDRGTVDAAYSYECKECTKKRITTRRQQIKNNQQQNCSWDYPDW